MLIRFLIRNPALMSVFVGLFIFLSISVVADADEPLPLPPMPDGSTVSPAEPRWNKFVVAYPSTARPVAITRKFVKPKPDKTPHEGVDLYAPQGTPITSGTTGKVKKIIPPQEDTRGYGGYIKVKTVVNGVKYKVYYGNLQNVSVSVGQIIYTGDIIGQSRGDAIKLVVQTSEGGISGFQIRNVMHPKKYLKLPALRLRPTVQNLRIRAEPNTDSEIYGLVNPWQLFKTKDTHYHAIVRMGKYGKWLSIKLKDGRVAYLAAWYVEVVSKRDPGVVADAPVRGVNIDPYSPNGMPDPLALSNIGWVRINYNVSYDPITGTYGNTDLTAAYNRYYPIIKQYAESGTRVILVLTHQLYGEGQGWVWDTFDSGAWANFTHQFTPYVQAVAGQYAGQGLVYAYQIWNEQDAPQGSVSAVGMSSDAYANLLASSINAIRAWDDDALILTGGHTGGPTNGVNYANHVLSLMPSGVAPDGIAVHPYGRGPAGSPFSLFGTLDESIEKWSAVMVGKPLWITEWGVLDLNGNDTYAQAVTDYAMGFLYSAEVKYKNAVASAVWYGWADGMDNGYGLVRTNGTARQPLYDAFLQIGAMLRAFG